MKTNIKMRVTPEQSEQVQKIIKGDILDITLSYPFLYLTEEDGLQHGSSEEIFENDETEEISPELFIRTNGTCEETKTEENKLEWIEYDGQELEAGKEYLVAKSRKFMAVWRFIGSKEDKELWKEAITAYMELPKPYEKPKSLKDRLDEAVEKYCYEFSDEEWADEKYKKYFIIYKHKTFIFSIDYYCSTNHFIKYTFKTRKNTQDFINSFTTEELMQIMKGEVK